MFISQTVLYLTVIIYLAFFGVDKQNLSRLKTSLADDVGRLEVHDSDLACHHHHTALPSENISAAGPSHGSIRME